MSPSPPASPRRNRKDVSADTEAELNAIAESNANDRVREQESANGIGIGHTTIESDPNVPNANTNGTADPNANTTAPAPVNGTGISGSPSPSPSPSTSPSSSPDSSPTDSEDAGYVVRPTHHKRRHGLRPVPAPVPGSGQGPSDHLYNPPLESSEADADDADADDAEDVDNDDADVIGVSMGLDQSRLKSRATPAEEKTRIMERNGGYFEDEGLFAGDITEEPESFETKREKEVREAQRDKELDKDKSIRPATRTGAGAGIGKVAAPVSAKEGAGGRQSFTRSLLNTLPLRPRAWSGDSGPSSKIKKFFPSLHLRTGSLTGLRNRSPSWSPRQNWERDQGSSNERSSSPRGAVSKPASAASNGTVTGLNYASGDRPGAPAEDPIGDLRPLQAPSAMTRGKHSFVGSNPTLRRSSSDQSLYLRASSTASSLEHRPQYEHVHQQTNSRFKAIKDTLQDSSSRLLSMPTLHLQDLRSDWGYKQFLSDANHRRTDTNETDETTGSNGGSPLEPRVFTEDSPRNKSPRKSVAATYPVLYDAMNELAGDVVVMGGYRGSILRSAKPPQRQLWVPMKVGLNLRKVDLEVGLTHEDEETMEDSIIPDGVLSHVGPVDICRRLLKRLQKCDNAIRGDLRVHNYGYDWRLSPHLLSKRLIKFLEGLPCNAPDVPAHRRGATVIAHSLGGLIARHAVNQRPELFAGVLYAGAPQHCVNILGPLRNGDDVLLSSRVLTAQVNFTFRTSFALLPEKGHCFIDKRTKKEYRLDFFDPANWDEYRLSPCINAPIPVSGMARSGSISRTMPLRKRFSTILSNSSAEDNSLDQDSSTSEHSPSTTDVSGNSTPIQAAANALKPSHHPLKGEGLPGPTTHPKGSSSQNPNTQPITISPAAAKQYLTNTLSEVLEFKNQTQHDDAHQRENKYPPFAVLFSKSVPTVYGARVSSKEGIKYADAYDDLAFAAGDGVCLASAAMLPPGYRVIRDGMVKSDRGHVGLLGDLEGVGTCLRALVRGRREGVGVEGLALS